MKVHVGSIAILCVSAVTLFLTTKPGGAADRKDLLTLQNKKGAVTLVTTLEDGSVVYLGDDAKLDYPSHFEANAREVYLSGKALFDISGNKERPFIIDTKDMRVEVLGTSFYINNENNTTFELAVKQGQVKVTYKKNGKDAFVQAGEVVRLVTDNLFVAPAEDMEAFIRYTQRMQFKDELLGNILRIVNKESDKVILQTTPELSNRPLTVTFSNNTPEKVAQLICLALDLSCTEKNGVLLLSDMN